MSQASIKKVNGRWAVGTSVASLPLHPTIKPPPATSHSLPPAILPSCSLQSTATNVKNLCCLLFIWGLHRYF
ncbi:hypothetical protein J6590_095876 [Homalodisca vitripennis]|nr:hypothetical protein J6590_095876 [Homalodisca vitripennis]